MNTSLQKTFVGFLCLCLMHTLSIVIVVAQTTPAMGLRQNTPTVHAFINARIVQTPGKTIEGATLLIRDGIITSVGSASIPRDARVWDMKGMTIYPGLIDAYADYGMPKPRQDTQDATLPGQPRESQAAESRGATSWTDAVMAHQNAAELFIPDTKAAEKLRSQGFTAALVVPQKGNLKGTSALVNLGAGKTNDIILAQQSRPSHTPRGGAPTGEIPDFTHGRSRSRAQTLLDAEWYQKAHDAYRKKPSLRRPETNESLAALKGVPRGGMPTVIETSDELDFLRAQAIGKEFGLNLIVLGSGSEYRQLQAVAASSATSYSRYTFPNRLPCRHPRKHSMCHSRISATGTKPLRIQNVCRKQESVSL